MATTATQMITTIGHLRSPIGRRLDPALGPGAFSFVRGILGR